jgi:hypothetical protein
MKQFLIQQSACGTIKMARDQRKSLLSRFFKALVAEVLQEQTRLGTIKLKPSI